MADTGDLKSPAQSRAYGFESRPWHQLRRHLMQVEIEISGSIPRGIGLGRAELRAAAEFFAAGFFCANACFLGQDMVKSKYHTKPNTSLIGLVCIVNNADSTGSYKRMVLCGSKS